MPTATPLFTKRDPATGAVLFDFEGHIHAEGLDLSGGPIAVPTDVQQIRWLLDTDGDQVATNYAYEAPVAGGNFFRQLRMQLDSKTSNASNLFLTDMNSQTNRGSARAQASRPDGSAFAAKTIIDSEGQSSYIMAEPANVGIYISNQYAIDVGGIGAGGGATKTYVHNLNLTNFWTVVGSLNQANGGAWLDNFTWAITGQAANSVTFTFYNKGGGVSAGSFYFHLIFARP